MSSGVPAPVNYASVAIPPAIPDFFSASLVGLSGKKYRNETHDFRDSYNHRFSPRFVIGITQMVKREVDKESGRVTYVGGGIEPLQLDQVATLLTMERDIAYRAFDAFQRLIHEHAAAISRFGHE